MFLDQAEKRRTAVTTLLGDLVHTPSLSSEEEDVTRRLVHEMTELGYDEVTVDGFGNVIGRIGTGPVTILYDSHVDTVGVGSRDEWSQDPFEPVLRGGIMYGRGASDDKGGISSMIHGGALYKQLARRLTAP